MNDGCDPKIQQFQFHTIKENFRCLNRGHADLYSVEAEGCIKTLSTLIHQRRAIVNRRDWWRYSDVLFYLRLDEDDQMLELSALLPPWPEIHYRLNWNSEVITLGAFCSTWGTDSVRPLSSACVFITVCGFVTAPALFFWLKNNIASLELELGI